MKAAAMRRCAEICFALAKNETSEPKRLRYMRMAFGWQDLAENQDWLDGAVARSSLPRPDLQNAA